MKHYWFMAVVLLLLVGLGGAGCSGEPAPVAPQAALTSAQPGSEEASALERMVPTLTTRSPQAGPSETTPESATGGTEVTPPLEAQELVRLAREDLAQRLGLATEAIRLISVKAVDWSDTSLGCPQPGMMYAQVITTGFLVVLEAKGKEYEYHTDEGRFVVLCEDKARSGGRRHSYVSDPSLIATTPLTGENDSSEIIPMQVKDYSLLCHTKRSGQATRSSLCP